MKKPYIKKFSKVSKFNVWIVDGKYIRDNIEEEFTNYGYHLKFKFIPKNELWIDRQKTPGEEKFYIDSMLAMIKLLSRGMSHKEAGKIADKIERSERSKSKLMQKEIRLKKDKEKLIDSIHKKLLKNYSNKKLKVWIVNGEAVRDIFFIDFTEGGHDRVYNFVPRNEIWIDDDLMPEDIKFVLLHEIYERRLMSKGMSYDSAHKKASHLEQSCRHKIKSVNSELKKELELQKKI